MSEGSIAYWVFCGISGINLLFLGIYLTNYLKENRENLFKTILFITVGFGLFSKSFFDFYEIFNNSINDLIKYSIWYLAYTIQGPCLYFFAVFIVNRNYFKKIDFIHLIPYVINFIGYIFFKDQISDYIFIIFAIIFFVYLSLMIIILIDAKRKQRIENWHEKAEALSCLQKVIIVFGLYRLVSLFLWLKFDIALDAFFIASISYLFIYLEFRYNKLSKPPYSNFKNKSLNTINFEPVIENIKSIFEKEEIYLNRDVTLMKLAETINVKPHIISRTINTYFKLNFNEFVNKYRIEKAKELLSDEKYINVKISYISYECGFNTISAFNKAFLKNVSCTPSQFRERMQNVR